MANENAYRIQIADPRVSLPARVKCNRGFGGAFWTVIVVTGCLTAVAVLYALMKPGDENVAWSLIIGASVVAIFLFTRAVLLPRLTIDLGQGTLKTRRKTRHFHEIAVIRFRAYGRSGRWADFLDMNGKVIARFAAGDTFFAAPTVEQWQALRHILASAPTDTTWTEKGPAGTRPANTVPARVAQPMGAAGPRANRSAWIDRAAGIATIDAQIHWCLAGNRSGSRHAPIIALFEKADPAGLVAVAPSVWAQRNGVPDTF